MLSEARLIHPCLLLLAFPALQTGRKLPPLPGDLHPCAVAREIADYAFGTMLEPQTLDTAGAAGQVRVAVHWGTLPAGEAEFACDEGRPPIQLGKPTDFTYTYTKQALFLLDAGHRLLAVSFESENAQRRLLSAMATARAPSRRFDEEELDWAWFSALGAGFRLPRVGFLEPLDGIPPQAGHVELALRFGDGEKLQILQPLRWKPALDAQDVEWLELAAHDVGACQNEAVRVLLEHHLPVPSAPFLSASNRLSARLAAGDEAARNEAIARLGRAERELLWDPRAPHTPAEIAEHEADPIETPASLLAIVARGPADLRPRIATFVAKGVENSVFAWLALGGTARELRELRGTGAPGLPPWELSDARTLEALDLSLEALRSCAERHPTEMSNELEAIDDLVRRLGRSAPNDVLERVRSTLRGCLETRGAEFRVRLTLVHAGDPDALAELARSKLLDGPSFPSELAALPGDEVVSMMVRSLVRHLAGFEMDDTCAGELGVRFLTGRLHARGAADRALALRLFDASELPPRTSAETVAVIRWALGELPEPRRLLEIGRTLEGSVCRLDLAAEAPRYAGILSELRADTRKHWWALAALHDETSLPVFGGWLTAKDGDSMTKLEALWALEKMGAPAGASYVYDALPELQRNLRDEAFTVLGEIEAPSGLARVASLCASSAATDPRTPAGNALFLLLGRRP